MKTKTIKPKTYRYVEALVWDWLHGLTPEQGSRYTGSTSRIEATPDFLYTGHRNLLLAVRNHKLKAILCMDTTFTPICGAPGNALRMALAAHMKLHHIPRFVPPTQRKSKWEARVYDLASPKHDYTAIPVCNLEHSLADCDLATLIDKAQHRVRLAAKTIKPWMFRRDWASYALCGYYHHLSSDEHRNNPPDFVVRQSFAALNIPFPEDVAATLAVMQAKCKLSQ